MAIEVRIPTILRTYTGGEKAVAGDGGTLADVLVDLDSRHPGLRDRIVDEKGLRRFVNVYVNDEDVRFIEAQMAGYYARLDLWYQRVWQLQGLWLDPNGRVIRHKGHEAVLTAREFELLQFLLDHPHRFYTASQITALAWSDAALYPEEVRNYVLRIRKILARLAIPCDLVNKPGKGYSLTFRDTP